MAKRWRRIGIAGALCGVLDRRTPLEGPLYFQSPSQENSLRSFAYKGYTISPRTFQLRGGSARWTLDLLIGRNGQLRAFGGTDTYATEASADTACNDLGCRIIDGAVRDCSVADLR
jgi:hypothetical protein